MNKIIYIYGLIDPIDNSLFYIGYTNNKTRRLNEHIKYKNQNILKDRIINKLLKNNLKPQLIEIDSTPLIFDEENKIYEHEKLEIMWIERAKNYGHSLVNMTSGGGNFGGINKIKVYQYDELGNFICEYESLTHASEKNNMNIGKLSMALDQKKNKSSYGYYWFSTKQLAKQFTFKSPHKFNKKIVCYDLNGKFIKIYNSQTQASTELNISSKSINKCLRISGYGRTGKYMWLYYDEGKFKNKIDPWVDNKIKPILKLVDNRIIEEYSSITEAAKENNILITSLLSNLKGKTKKCGGYKWKYK